MPHASRYLAALLFLATLALGQAPATADEWKIDTTHATIAFAVSHMNVSDQHGRFNTFDGSVTTGDNPAFAFTVQADSVDTNNAKRDDHLRSPDFFNTKQFPTISFTSTAVTANDAGYELTGDLNLHGVTESITVQLNKVGEIDDPWGNHRAGFETSFTIKRSDYGMENMLEMIGDEVTLTVIFEAIRQ